MVDWRPRLQCWEQDAYFTRAAMMPPGKSHLPASAHQPAKTARLPSKYGFGQQRTFLHLVSVFRSFAYFRFPLYRICISSVVNALSSGFIPSASIIARILSTVAVGFGTKPIRAFVSATSRRTSALSASMLLLISRSMIAIFPLAPTCQRKASTSPSISENVAVRQGDATRRRN